MFKSDHLPTHKERILQLDAIYDSLIQNDGFKPFGYPLGAFGVNLVILYLLVDHRNRPLLRHLRWIIWAVNTAFSIYVVTNFRGRGAVAGYAVGLGTWWSVIWTTTLLIAYDGQNDFSRIERTEGATRSMPLSTENGVHNEIDGCEGSKGDRPAWQAYPTASFAERVDWVFDLMSNFRGMAWNWRIPNLPDPPKEVQTAIKEVSGGAVKKLGRPRPTASVKSREQMLSDARKQLIIGYLCLDFIRTLMIHDPFFSGLGHEHVPTYLPHMMQEPIVLQGYRLLVGLFAVYWALATIFSLAPLFFVGLLGSKRIGVRGETWMYPREWGSYRSVLDRGLAGWWGEWWHQSFRFGFEAPSRRLTQYLSIDSRSLKGKVLQLFIAFALSGSLHGVSSHTSLGDTRPFGGPFLFFFLQPFGIIGQMMLTLALRRTGISQRMPVSVRQAVSFIYVHIWLYLTAPLFIYDLAKGGQFLYEPVPFSIFRAIGFGGKDDWWYCWEGRWFRWYSGEHWWESGIVT